jgi:hypothetical protein
VYPPIGNRLTVVPTIFFDRIRGQLSSGYRKLEKYLDVYVITLNFTITTLILWGEAYTVV